MRLREDSGKWNYQSGDLLREEAYYRKTIDLFPKRKCQVLDVGSGCVFGFEKMLFKYRADYQDMIDCVDISPLSNAKPVSVRNYYQYNIEDKIQLNKKYDVVVCFEVMEHIDHTDILLENCYDHLKRGGFFFICIPNLASIYSRIELLLGFQPHILEISNEYGNFGGGLFAKLNNSKGSSIHHIRGITYRACNEMIRYKGFKILKSCGFSHGKSSVIYKHFPGVAPEIWFECTKL